MTVLTLRERIDGLEVDLGLRAPLGNQGFVGNPKGLTEFQSGSGHGLTRDLDIRGDGSHEDPLWILSGLAQRVHPKPFAAKRETAYPLPPHDLMPVEFLSDVLKARLE